MANKIKVLLRVNTLWNNHHDMADPYNPPQVQISMCPVTRQYAFRTDGNDTTAAATDIMYRAFNMYLRDTIPYDIHDLYNIIDLLKSANVSNQFEMFALNEQILPLLMNFIAQADPSRYELEIIK